MHTRDVPGQCIAVTSVRPQSIPWTPHAHRLFPESCQQVIRTLLLGLHRVEARHPDLALDPYHVEFVLEGVRRDDYFPAAEAS